MQVSIVSIAVNAVLTLFKLFVGIAAQSGAMVSDAVHSASDVFSTLIVIAGVTVAEKRPDSGHPYGHERMECVASLLLAVILAATGIGIGAAGMKRITEGGSLSVPGMAALLAAVISIAVKEWMFRFTKRAAGRIKSGALMADAWHHRSDALSSVGAFAGILGARLGFPVLDPAAGLVICIFIEKAALEIFRDASDKLVDKACPTETAEKIRAAILGIHGVEQIDLLNTRLFGSRIYVDVEISMDGSKSLTDSHQTAEAVHLAVENAIPEVKHCMVHVNPLGKEKESKIPSEKISG